MSNPITIKNTEEVNFFINANAQDVKIHVPNTTTISFIKTHPDAVLPYKKIPTDTGYDLTSVEDVIVPAKGNAIIPTGLKVADILVGYWFLILPRSGLGFKHGLQPHLGTIDNPYRGDLGVKMYNFSDTDYQIKKGDRVAQFAVLPVICPNIEWSDTATTTDRGERGFGHTGR